MAPTAAAVMRRTPGRAGRGSRAPAHRMRSPHFRPHPRLIAQLSPGRHRTDKPWPCAQPISASGRVESCKATVSCASSLCDGPRSVEAASNSANGPPMTGWRVGHRRDPQIGHQRQHARHDQSQEPDPAQPCRVIVRRVLDDHRLRRPVVERSDPTLRGSSCRQGCAVGAGGASPWARTGLVRVRCAGPSRSATPEVVAAVARVGSSWWLWWLLSWFRGLLVPLRRRPRLARPSR